MKYLHLFSGDENQKFSLPFIKFIDNNFDIKEHKFLILAGKNKKLKKELEGYKNTGILPTNIKGSIRLIKEIRRADTVFFHGLNLSKYSFFIVSSQIKQLKKCNWVIWGGDLYEYKFRNMSFKSSIKEILRRRIIKNIGGLITHLRGDYKLAKDWYGAKGKYYYCFMYPSNLYKEVSIGEISKEDQLYIQVGNSACPTNEHIEVLNKLARFKDKNIKIICPLSYSGKKDYIDKVVKKGLAIFGEEQFFPMLDFLPYEEYVNLLGRIDVAIFNHQRQRGLGNIITLLSMGKKVYIREEITTWNFCKDHGLKVYSANTDLKDIFVPLSDTAKESNRSLMKKQFSKEKLINDLKKVFTI